jgi:tetratricopeptide (TPR) repeat protein
MKEHSLMEQQAVHLSNKARYYIQNNDWLNVSICANQLKKINGLDPEFFFLKGMVEKSVGNIEQAKQEFTRCIEQQKSRYDAAIELANINLLLLQYESAYQLVKNYVDQLSNSPLYLSLAAKIFTGLGMHLEAYPLYCRAVELQPEVDSFRETLAACEVLLGKVKDAKRNYKALLAKYPNHQKNHYELSKLEKASTDKHIDEMKRILRESPIPESNIYLYYAIGKELEDRGKWDEAFLYFEKGGNAVKSVSNYKVDHDLKLLADIIDTCNKPWLNDDSELKSQQVIDKTPIFIVGLPRSGTTLTERIISSHSLVNSADETFFMQYAIRSAAGIGGISDIDSETLIKASKINPQIIASKYLETINYRLDDSPYFIDKYPFNYLYLGFIAKAFPNAKIIYLNRNPLDSCFAMYKQSFFKFAYNLSDLGQYYIAQNKLRNHWVDCLASRIIEVKYEELVTNQVSETKRLLNELNLAFEPGCLEFEKNPAASATASTLQVREKVHTRSLYKWRKFEKQLSLLEGQLNDAGITTRSSDNELNSN